MKKSIFLFFAAILCATSLNAAYFYRGNQNSWGATEMTTSSDGFYSYYKAKSYKDNGNQNNNFKIATSKDGWNYNGDYLKSGFNGTNVTNMGKWDGDNCGIYHTTAYYVLIYHPNSAINTTDKPIICASTTLPDSRNHGFEQDNNGIKFYHGSDTEWKFNGQTAQTKNLNTITQLYLKEWFVQLYENWDGAKGNVKMQYNIHLAKNTPGNYTDLEKNWTDGQGTWSNYYSYPKYGNNSLNINLLEGLGSGKYTMSFKYYDKDLNITSPIHKLNWEIAVPDITSAECSSNGTGLGTEDSPFMVPEGDILTLTVKGTQKSNDANSELYAQFASNEYSSTLTHNITPTTTIQSITIKVKYYNSVDKLSSNENTLTIYYKAIQEETHIVTISCQCNENKIENIDDEIVKVGVSTPSEITAPAIAGYTFDSWEPRDGITQKSVAGNAITIITKTGFNESDYTLVANYNEDLTSGWTLKGSFVDDFATAYDFTKKSGESTGKVAYVSIDLETDKEYQFKVVEGKTWYGNNNSDEQWWIKQTVENWDFYHAAGNCHMKTGLAGTYTFKIDYSGSNPKVSVIYPIAYTITATAANGIVEGAGTYVEGTTVSLKATPAEGYHFVKWSNESTINPLTITVTEDIELQAIFDINTYTVTTTAENGKVTGTGEYTHGTEVTLTATPGFDYKFVKWSNESTENPLTITVTEDVTLEAIFEEVTATDQTLSGKFSTGKYEYAEFATGNLQYKKDGEDETWRFAKQQYQYVGEDNINVGDPNYEGWIDMFGWSTDATDNNFGVNPSLAKDFYNGNFVDWGTKMGEGWKTLTEDQWKYLLYTRANATNLKQIAFVDTVFGVMLFPDNWEFPSGCTVAPTLNHDDAAGDRYDFYSYNYDLYQWQKMEMAGAVFLPAAGRRCGGYGNIYKIDGSLSGTEYKLQYATNGMACYWTSSKHSDGQRASALFNLQVIGDNDFKYSTLHNGWYGDNNIGQSVRLAKVSSTLVEIGGGDNSAVITANAGKEMDVQVNRTFKANDGYYTICLPFTIDADEIGKAYQVTSISDAGAEGFYMVFNEVTELVAGQPYLIEPNDLTNPIFEDVTIVNTTGDTVTATGAGINFEMVGVINGGGKTELGQYWVGEKGYFYNGDGTQTTDKLGLRVLFNITNTEGQRVNVRARVVLGENAATGLNNITNGENTTIKVIENGQLVIIRNGEKFNAQGMRF